MKEKNKILLDPAKLRRLAEERLKKITKKTLLPKTIEESLRLVQELQTHQIELEIINEELQESRGKVEEGLNQYTDLYDFAPVGYFSVLRNGKICRTNLTGSSLLGVARSQLINRRFSLFVSEETRPVFNDFFLKVFESKIKTSCEVSFLNNGKELHYIKIDAIVSDDGQECKMTVVDITEIKRAEKTLQNERLLLRTVIDNIPDSIYSKDLASCKTLANVAEVRIMGAKSEAEVLGKDDFDMYPKEIAEKFFADDQSVMQTGTPVLNREEYVFDEKGQKRWLLSSKLPLRNKDNQIIGLVGVGRDITERKKAEKSFKKANEEWERTFDAITDQIMILDTEYNIVKANKTMTAVLGPLSENPFGLSCYESVHGTKAPPAFCPHAMLLKDGKSHSNEVYEPRLGGYFIITVSPLFTPEGNLAGSIHIARDISERKKMELELSASELRNRNLLETARDIIFTISPEGTITSLNHAFDTITGLSRQDWIGKNIGEGLVHPDDWPRAEEIVRRTVLGEIPPLTEVRILSKSGEYLIGEFIMSPQFINGKVSEILGVGRDVTERKKIDEKLRSNEEQMRDIIYSVGDWVWEVDENGRYTYSSNKSQDFFGFGLEEVIGKTPFDFMPPDEAARVKAIFSEIVLNKAPIKDLENWNIRKNGEKICLLTNGVPIVDKHGNFKGYRGVDRDITERKNAEATKKNLEVQLQQSQKMESIGTLASGIAHDFNNILGIILGHSSLLELLKEDPQKLSRSIEAITKATQRGASLVKQLLTFARKTESHFETVYINEIIKEIKKFLQETIHKTIVISTSLHEDLPSIVADTSQIHQVLMNLCVNARDAMPNGGTLAISTSTIQSEMIHLRFPNITARQYVKIEVADTGMGMDEATKQRIFEPFFTTKGPGKGTGLDLAMVFGIVEHHKGFIDVRSVLGEGTSFTVYLPIVERSVEDLQPVQKSIQEIRGGTETVLIIEDEVMLIELMKASLVSKGYTVFTAEDGVRGVELYQIHQNQISLVLSDLGLPLLDGKEVFKKIREINPKAKMIIASGFIEPEIKSEMYKAGLKNFIQKPYSYNEVLQKIREVIDAKE